MAWFFFLGLMALEGCMREAVVDTPEQVIEGPVQVTLTLDLRPFGGGECITKADFVDVDEKLHYAHEKVVKDMGVFIFDASSAFDDSGPKLVFDPALATFKAVVEPSAITSLDGSKIRVDLELDKPYGSIAVLVMANYHTGYSASGSTLQEIVTTFASDDASALAFSGDQSVYLTGGIPMHGYQVFGTLEGLDSGASESQKEMRRLKYYKGMRTPLTRYGFNTSSELTHYADETDGYGTVRESDCLPMEYALSRLHLRYEPSAGQIKADSVEVSSVKLHLYRDKFRPLPAGFLARTHVTPFDGISDVGSFVTATEIEFKKVTVTTLSGTESSWVAYVPEMNSMAVKTAMAADPLFKEASLTVTVKVKPRYRTGGAVTEFTYTVDGVRVDDGVNPPYTRINPAWTAWLKLRTSYARNDKDGNAVPVGTMFNLVRHYSYEWVAIGVDR